jgi:hypothetical protein
MQLLILRAKRDRCPSRHCEERSDDAIQASAVVFLDCFASLAMTVSFGPSVIAARKLLLRDWEFSGNLALDDEGEAERRRGAPW